MLTVRRRAYVWSRFDGQDSMAGSFSESSELCNINMLPIRTHARVLAPCGEELARARAFTQRLRIRPRERLSYCKL